eukprot:GHVU01034863.1.p5 GENE.GHVU01034863.1~~GHVU01034863.1.p5  ORF type:complete len:105 (-),score=12.92 GHVU01034863.1:117-431(-)
MVVVLKLVVPLVHLPIRSEGSLAVQPATAANSVISAVLPGDAVSKLYPHIKRARRKPDQPQQQEHQQQEQLVHPQVRGKMTSDLPGATSVDTAGAIDVPPAALA